MSNVCWDTYVEGGKFYLRVNDLKGASGGWHDPIEIQLPVTAEIVERATKADFAWYFKGIKEHEIDALWGAASERKRTGYRARVRAVVQAALGWTDV